MGERVGEEHPEFGAESGHALSGRASKGNSAIATHLFWTAFAAFEFVVTVFLGMLLYLGGALYFAARVYVLALGGLVKRASALAVHRFRDGRVFASASGGKTTPAFSEIAARHVQAGQRRSRSWLN